MKKTEQISNFFKPYFQGWATPYFARGGYGITHTNKIWAEDAISLIFYLVLLLVRVVEKTRKYLGFGFYKYTHGVMIIQILP